MNSNQIKTLHDCEQCACGKAEAKQEPVGEVRRGYLGYPIIDLTTTIAPGTKLYAGPQPCQRCAELIDSFEKREQQLIDSIAEAERQRNAFQDQCIGLKHKMALKGDVERQRDEVRRLVKHQAESITRIEQRAAIAERKLAEYKSHLATLHDKVKGMQEVAYTFGEHSQESVRIALDGVIDAIIEAEKGEQG